MPSKVGMTSIFPDKIPNFLEVWLARVRNFGNWVTSPDPAWFAQRCHFWSLWWRG